MSDVSCYTTVTQTATLQYGNLQQSTYRVVARIECGRRIENFVRMYEAVYEGMEEGYCDQYPVAVS